MSGVFFKLSEALGEKDAALPPSGQVALGRPLSLSVCFWFWGVLFFCILCSFVFFSSSKVNN